MRMGYMILPESLLPAYERALGAYSCTVPVLEQYALAEFIDSGSFERHLSRKRRKLAREGKQSRKITGVSLIPNKESSKPERIKRKKI